MTTETGINIHISRELEGLITPLSEEEFAQLKSSLLSQGCRNPLMVWENKGKTILVDGYHRFKICKKNQIPYEIRIMSFSGMDEAKEWMINNQLGRRNLNPLQLIYFRGMMYLSSKKDKGGFDNVLSKGQINQTTAESLAHKFKASPSTIKRDAQFAIGLSGIGRSNPELKKNILIGKLKINKSDINMLSLAKKDFSVSNEVDIKDLAAHIRRSQLKEVEEDLAEINQKRVEKAQEILREKEPIFLNREDRIKTIKGKIISAINDAVKNKNLEAIGKIKELIDKLEMAIFQE